MVVRTVGDDAEAEFRHFGRHGLGVFDNLGRIVLEFGLQSFSETGRLGGNDVHEGAALHSGEDGCIQFFGVFLLADDEAAAGAAQGFMRGGGDEVRIGNRIRVLPPCHQARDVGHVHEQVGTAGPGNLAHAFKVDCA